MLRKHGFAEGEIYHICNRGAHKQKIFKEDSDYGRFLLLLYISNTTQPVETRLLLKKYGGPSSGNIFQEEIGEKLIEIFSYCLMPNHFHLVLRQLKPDGIEKFIRKLATAYSMYFNIKY